MYLKNTGVAFPKKKKRKKKKKKKVEQDDREIKA